MAGRLAGPPRDGRPAAADGWALALLKSGELKLQYSSSAKGGLAVAAIGLVPEVTLEVGKIAAQSAGALRAGDVRVAALFLSDVIGAPGQALVWGAKDPLNGREAGEFFDERWSAFLTIWGVESVPVA